MRRQILFPIIATILFISALSLSAQTLNMGNALGVPNSSDLNGGPVRTNIDLNAPASATGTITTVTYSWSSTPCTNAFKIKFFRRSGDTLTMITERGPFSSAADNHITLSPAVSVLQGDLIGITRVASCGNSGTLSGIVNEGYVQYTSDVTGSVSLAAGTRAGAVLGVAGSGTATEAVAQIITVVGSTAGGFGSNFKTGVQLFNGRPGGGSISGRLVFHRAGANGSAADPSFPYTLSGGQVLSVADIVASLGQTGLGSMDLILAAGQTAPTAVVRVFNDAGSAGTSGLTEDLIQLALPVDSRIMPAGATGYMVTPPDPTKARFNIGVRALFGGATVTATLKDSTGATIVSVTKSYPPTWFEQVDSTTFFNGTAIGANQSITISVSSGAAIIYGSTNDNITNDPSVQFVKVAFAIA
ncbi:MAG TPA: hypothetical protein VEZ11_01175 [Thermoanaerobaculia bacterium]|nr:hypothetical protein [Thermoanaerobaculia bacterium]